MGGSARITNSIAEEQKVGCGGSSRRGGSQSRMEGARMAITPASAGVALNAAINALIHKRPPNNQFGQKDAGVHTEFSNPNSLKCNPLHFPHPMIQRFKTSWALFKASCVILQQNPRLLLFPMITAICTTVMVLFFLAPVLFVPTGYPITSPQHWEHVAARFGESHSRPERTKTYASNPADPKAPKVSVGVSSQQITVNPLWAGYGILTYLVAMAVATFFNVAFCRAIMDAFSGAGVSLRNALSFAVSRWKGILLWSLFAGLVGLIIRAIAERSDMLGKLVMGLLGAVWSVASVFVAPLLVCSEENNPIELLKSSASTIKRTWGEALIGYVGIGLVSVFMVIPFLAIVIVIVGIAASGYFQGTTVAWIGGVMVGIFILASLVLSYVSGVANQLFRCALFLYANQGVIPEQYSAEMLNGAWKMKKA
jgi:hypothetical protein